MKFSNRITLETFVRSAIFEENIVKLTTDDGVFVVPSTTLTQKIFPDEQFPYILEYHTSTRVLSGVTSPEGTILYRLNDDQVRVLSQSIEHLSRLYFEGVPLDVEDAVNRMMNETQPIFLERLKTLPSGYMSSYFIYELKVSYLASSPVKPYIFDPSPFELSHALALSMAASSDYPPLILKAY